MKQVGFTKTDAALTLLIVLALAVSGFVYFKKNHTPGAGTPSIGTPAGTSVHKPADAQPVVQNAFTAAVGYAGTQTKTPQGSVDIVKPYLSAGLYGKLTKQVSAGADRNVVLCSQSIPDSAKAVLNDTSDGIATVLVNEAFGASHATVTTTVDLKTLKIVSLTCPPAGQ
jgi:hypothetical protein